MTVCVFLGPTLPVEVACEVLQADYRPPVRQGDVYRAVKELRPLAIGIVDGFFLQVPSVWHKEILWAMAEGVHVFGSASMGALRAAELEAFGMRGVGAVFAAFRDGVVEDDDEVAVIHGPEETGYVAISEAMINIRLTLASAHDNAIVKSDTKDALECIAKSLHFPRRTYSAILAEAAAANLAPEELSGFRAWLPTGRVDQKRDDSIAMLLQLRDLMVSSAPPLKVDYRFEHTSVWALAKSRYGSFVDPAVAEEERRANEWLLDELKLDGQLYQKFKLLALLRLLADAEGEWRAPPLANRKIRLQIKEFRMNRGLYSGRDFDHWLSERGLSRQSWQRRIEDNALLDALAYEYREQLEPYLIDELRNSDEYERVTVRAAAKKDCLTSESVALESVDLPHSMEILAWYFEERLGTQLPSDMEVYAIEQGFANVASFQRAVIREYYFESAQIAE